MRSFGPDPFGFGFQRSTSFDCVHVAPLGKALLSDHYSYTCVVAVEDGLRMATGVAWTVLFLSSSLDVGPLVSFLRFSGLSFMVGFW